MPFLTEIPKKNTQENPTYEYFMPECVWEFQHKTLWSVEYSLTSPISTPSS